MVPGGGLLDDERAASPVWHELSRAVNALAPKAKRITDKMPLNFLFAGLIHLTLPNARIIHVHRDPLDTCFSCFSKLFADHQHFSYDLGELGRFYRGYEALVEHWRKVLPSDVMLEVQYEQLISDLEGEVRRMIAHCGLEWDDACLSVRSNKKASAHGERGASPTTHISQFDWQVASLRAPTRAVDRCTGRGCGTQLKAYSFDRSGGVCDERRCFASSD